MCVCVNPHLQRGQHYLFHRGEVGLPQELCLLPEGQDLILVDGAHRGRDLQAGKNNSESAQALVLGARFKLVPTHAACPH